MVNITTAAGHKAAAIMAGPYGQAGTLNWSANSPAAALTGQRMIDRGIYNTSTALNQQGLSNSQELWNMQMQAAQLAQQQQQLAMQEQDRQQAQDNHMLDKSLDWL